MPLRVLNLSFLVNLAINSPVLCQRAKFLFYAWLASDIGDNWLYNDYSYSSACGAPDSGGPPVMPNTAYPSAAATVTNDSQFWSPQNPVSINYTTDQGDAKYFGGENGGIGVTENRRGVLCQPNRESYGPPVRFRFVPKRVCNRAAEPEAIYGSVHRI